MDFCEYVPVKPAGAQEPGVNYIRAVCCADYKNPLHFFEPIKFCEQLVYNSLCYMGSAVPASYWGNCIQLIKENYTGRNLARFCKYFSDCALRFTNPF